MMNQSTKPYLIRSIYDWCSDNGFTPYISVKVFKELDIPKEYVRDNEIVFNISAIAVHELNISNDGLSFTARFSGIAKRLDIPLDAIKGIFAKEVNQGITFSPDDIENRNNIESLENRSFNQNTQIFEEKKVHQPKLRIIK
ncbi:ClpXP protease specificity-enhancing factor [Nitrosomonas sp. sh817]|uniref:ClpXP protease specificity-enhancing factor n=1 Tax=unclassified Nitrosomonas TaxID=2609265 RepID=UPI0027DC2C33|nr:ClpXP protease specificity-enhancing factor [Nitrosomonas sp. sh817]WMJ09301.1 ClpXP protease specificity-enhancing factor [Nitrosomonas sp. sh817]